MPQPHSDPPSDPPSTASPTLTSKRFYRCRAHSNPFRDAGIERPAAPSAIDWAPHFANAQPPALLDIGCGYGRFLLALPDLLPGNALGLEIREKVVAFVAQHTRAMPRCSVMMTNALLFLPNVCLPQSLSHIFILFPDPHFKARKQKGRVVCRQTLAVFHYVLRVGGLLYVSTDVTALFQDMCATVEASGFFARAEEEEMGAVFERCHRDTDEALRAGKKSGHTYARVYRRVTVE